MKVVCNYILYLSFIFYLPLVWRRDVTYNNLSKFLCIKKNTIILSFKSNPPTHCPSYNIVKTFNNTKYQCLC